MTQPNDGPRFKRGCPGDPVPEAFRGRSLRYPDSITAITHEPSGTFAVATESRSAHKQRVACWEMLRGKLYAGPPPEHEVRVYDLASDEARITAILDGDIPMPPETQAQGGETDARLP